MYTDIMSKRVLTSKYSCLSILAFIIIVSPISLTTTLVLAQSSPTNATALDKIPSLSNIVGLSIVDGIKVSGYNIGDSDLSVTLKRQPTTGSNASNVSLPVTVIGAKLPINNLTQAIKCLPLSLYIANNSMQIISLVEDSSNTGMPTGLSRQTASSTATQTNASLSQILSLLQKAQLGVGSVVNSNWSSPQTISMGLLGQGNLLSQGNRAALPAPTNCVLAIVVPFVGVTSVGTIPLK